MITKLLSVFKHKKDISMDKSLIIKNKLYTWVLPDGKLV